jgi:hypothetical protein
VSDREHILIIVPSLDHTVSASVAHLFSASQQKNGLPGKYLFSNATMAGLKGYDFARNCAVKKFLDSPCDRLWMIDDDIMPTLDVFGILDADADIVAPLMPTLKWDLAEKEFNFHVAYAAGAYWDLNDLSTTTNIDISSGGPVDVDMVGTGCIVIKRDVLEDPRMRYPSNDLGPDDPPAIFRYHRKSNGAPLSGEDEDFCVRARRLGYRVQLHTGIETGHLDFIDIAQAHSGRKRDLV